MSKLAKAAIALGLGGAGIVLFLFDPAQHGFYPICFFRFLTGLNCPGCGATRALYQLMHGNIKEAAHLNLLLLVSLAYAAFRGALYAGERLQGKRAAFAVSANTMWAFGAVALAFGIVRNLPGFEWLSP